MRDPSTLLRCPHTPNCVSTEAGDPSKRMEPIPCTGPSERTVERLVDVIERMPGGRVVRREGTRIRAEFTTRIFGFVDDVDMVVDPEAGVVRFRSASRTGTWDLGANRRRMKGLRRRFLAG